VLARRRALRITVVVALLFGTVLAWPVPANATTSSTICNKLGPFVTKNCMSVDAVGLYFESAHVYVDYYNRDVKGHWEFRYRIGGQDRHKNSADILWRTGHPWALAVAEYTTPLRSFLDDNTYMCSRFWRNYAPNQWDLPAGDWNCIKATR
jgi:hypothetical protein